ncbi:hypothetical protein SAMN06265377_2832 [Flagellimonas pacifica]|uniref:Uncharacterized protein n=1 Tax=Flagellimonas pacifica TaxID=1247520 RepID=A0A285MUZ1_9FLAO|nr:hypothetical protein SAMN06265377_2832 [Allomuricauda parva]
MYLSDYKPEEYVIFKLIIDKYKKNDNTYLIVFIRLKYLFMDCALPIKVHL